MTIGTKIFFAVWIAFAYLATPLALILGWYRFSQNRRLLGPAPWASFVAFVGASASATLAIGSLVYGRVRGGWAYYDPPLMRIYAFGFFLSAGSLLLALVGMWKTSALRWWSTIAALGILMFWIMAAASE